MNFYEVASTKDTEKVFGILPLHLFDGITVKTISRKLFVRTIANFLILYSLFMVGTIFYEPFMAEMRYQYDSAIGTSYVVEDTAQAAAKITQKPVQKGKLGQVLGSQSVVPLVPKDPEFSIVIPKLGVNANIIKNVNSANENSYMDALKTGVAHAAGTSFPGQNQNIYLFAHSTNTATNVTRYNAIFYLLYKLEKGDELDVFYKGVRYTYTVTGKEIVSPADTWYLTRKTEGEMLTVQTCWPPGTVAQRMLVFAEPAAKVAER